MSQPDTFDERDDDATLESLLSPLKQVQPPDAARQEFRATVAAELAGAAARRLGTPWWRRSIEVPVPVALAAALLVLIAAGWRLMKPQSTVSHPTQPQATLPAPIPFARSAPDAIAALASKPDVQEGEYYSTEIYVCGIGRISSVSGYTFREEDHVP